MPLTRQQLYDQTYGRPKPVNGAGFYSMTEDNWRHDPRSNPLLGAADDTDRMLAYNRQVYDLSNQLYTKNAADRAAQQTAMLKSLVAQPSVNLFERPTTETEAQAQEFVQNALNTQKRGWNLTWADRNRRRKETAENLATQMKLQDQAMQRGKYIQDRAVTAARLKQTQEDSADRNEYRADTMEAKKIAMADRATQQHALQADKEYQMALHLIEKTGAGTNQLIDAFPNLAPEHFQRLAAAERALREGDQEAYNQIQSEADNFSDQLDEAISQAESNYRERNKPGWFRSGPDESAIEAEKKRARESFLRSHARDPRLRDITIDPLSGDFIPLMSEPRGVEALDMARLQRRGQQRPSAVGYGNFGAAPQMRNGLPVLVNAAQGAALPRGARFYGPDGRQRVKF